jgi:pimeloyl-ACP methyl ester carboxylesterase
MKDLILLHGALGSSESMTALKELLSDEYRCHTLDFSGHGTQSFNPEGFGIEYFAEELLAYIDEHSLQQPDVFGYSMGGYVALYTAFQTPNLLDRIMTLGTKFAWSPEAADEETSRMNPEVMEEKIPIYTKKLEAAHGEQWKELVWQTAGMMMELGEEPLLTIETLNSVQNEVLIMRGSEDQMVNDVESKWAVAHLPTGQYKELPQQPHPIEKVDTLLLKDSIHNFLDD